MRFYSFVSTLSTAILIGTLAQAKPVDITADNFVMIANAGIETRDGRTALVLASPQEGSPFSFGAAVLKDVVLQNGVIEYDISFDETRTFGGVDFRMQDGGNYEDFYMRAHQSGNPDAIQYMPRFNGVPSWQIYYGPQYAAPVSHDHGNWTPVRLEISGDQVDIYIGGGDKPVLASVLQRDAASGGVRFWGLNLGGPVWISNISVTPAETLDLVGTPVPEVPAAAGSVMSWQVSDAFDGAVLEQKTELGDMAASLAFHPLAAEITGIVNLSRLQGVAEQKDTVLARIEIEASSDMTRRFEFGFSDRARVFLNGQLLYDGADVFRSRDYRFLGTVGLWDSLYLPLKSGKNELVIAVTESVSNKTGWAVLGRFSNSEGLEIK